MSEEPTFRPFTCKCCGFMNRSEGARNRSSDQHRRYFSMCHEAWLQWPEKNDADGSVKREFEDPDTFRKWIQMKAGYYDLHCEIHLEGRPRDKVLMEISYGVASAGHGGAYVVTKIFSDPDGSNARMKVFKSRSIAYPDGQRNGMPHLEFCKLSDDVANMIRSIGKLDPEQLLIERTARGHK